MSISASGSEVKSTIIGTPSTSGGTEVTRKVDATEDREIVGIQIHAEDLGPTETHNIDARVFLGNDPFAGSDYQSDNEQFTFVYDLLYSFSAGDSAASGPGGQTVKNEMFGDNGFAWDEHVTLTVQHRERNSTASSLEVIVYWVEA